MNAAKRAVAKAANAPIRCPFFMAAGTPCANKGMMDPDVLVDLAKLCPHLAHLAKDAPPSMIVTSITRKENIPCTSATVPCPSMKSGECPIMLTQTKEYLGDKVVKTGFLSENRDPRSEFTVSRLSAEQKIKMPSLPNATMPLDGVHRQTMSQESVPPTPRPANAWANRVAPHGESHELRPSMGVQNLCMQECRALSTHEMIM